MKSNGHKTETPDVSHIRNVEVEHETSDINVRAVLVFVAVLTVTTVAVSLGMLLLFRFFNAEESQQERKRGPMAVTSKEERLPPKPRLQAAPGFQAELPDGHNEGLELQAPQAEYRTLKRYWDQALNGQLKDQSGNPIGVPIKDAMDQIVAGQGLPASDKGRPNNLKDNAIDMPTAASSGRQIEKRLQ